tara:strand:- start:315 stop:455 length:141 start_codon:yes stop_codon:yes gene_type:complete
MSYVCIAGRTPPPVPAGLLTGYLLMMDTPAAIARAIPATDATNKFT